MTSPPLPDRTRRLDRPRPLSPRPRPAGPRIRDGLVGSAVRAATAAALVVDAVVHFRDAGFYDAVATSVVSQGTLFRVEGAAAVVLAVLLLVRPTRWVWAAALVVAGSAAAAVLLYTSVDPGALGPLPDMYEPTWALPGKPISAITEVAGALLAAIGLARAWPAGAAASTLYRP